MSIKTLMRSKSFIWQAWAATASTVIAAFLFSCSSAPTTPNSYMVSDSDTTSHHKASDSVRYFAPVDKMVASEIKAKNSLVHHMASKDRKSQAVIKSLEEDNAALLKKLDEKNREIRQLENSYDSLLDTNSLFIARQEYFLSVYKEKYGALPNQ